MKWLLSLMLFTSVTAAMAEVAPEHIETMLQQMVKENIISAQEAEKAKIRLKSMGPEHWAQVNNHVAKVSGRTPASVIPSSNKVEEVHNIDLDGAQFKAIESELRKIVPQYED